MSWFVTVAPRPEASKLTVPKLKTEIRTCDGAVKATDGQIKNRKKMTARNLFPMGFLPGHPACGSGMQTIRFYRS